jgi:hypothetical protein
MRIKESRVLVALVPEMPRGDVTKDIQAAAATLVRPFPHTVAAQAPREIHSIVVLEWSLATRTLAVPQETPRWVPAGQGLT